MSPGGFVASPEGDSGSTIWNLPVTLSSPAGVPVTVDWSTLDIASNPLVAHPGSDYVADSGTLTFAPGETAKNIPIEILGDTVDEPPLFYGEWGLVQLSNPVNTTVTGGLFGLGLFIIIDDDP
jgi:Calx-beta domain